MRPLARLSVAALAALAVALAFQSGFTQAAFSDQAKTHVAVNAKTWGSMLLTYDMAAPGCVATSPVVLGAGGSLSGTVDWGDGTSAPLTANASHTFKAKSKYSVRVAGAFAKYTTPVSGANAACLTEVAEWTDETGTADISAAFRGATNLTRVARIPSSVTNMYLTFQGASSFNQAIGGWDTSRVTNMSGLFLGATSFNQPLNSWDVSRVTNLDGMFFGAASFNRPLSAWNTARVTQMGDLLSGATSFNQSLEAWNVSKVTAMNGMFSGAEKFNQPLASWNTSNVTRMDTMFYAASSFTQNIRTWNVSKVTMSGLFDHNTGVNAGGWPSANKPAFA